MKNNLHRLFQILLIFALTTSVRALDLENKLNTKINKIIVSRNYSPESIGVYVRELGCDSAIVNINGNKKYILASLSKLITGTVAYDILGSDYFFSTDVFVSGRFNPDSGIVEGNLYVRGNGDPGFTAQRLWLFVQYLYHRGIRQVNGDLILDDSYFDTVTTGPGFSKDNSCRAYEAPTSALSANFNTVAVYVAPGGSIGSPLHVIPFPNISGVKIISTAKTVKAGSSNSVRVRTKKFDGRTSIVVYGGMALNDKPIYKYRKVWEVPNNFGWIIKGLFEQCGITLKGDIKHSCIPESVLLNKEILSFKSESLNKFINSMFKYSNNFTAEMLFKTIGVKFDSIPGSWQKGEIAVKTWWKDKKLPDNIDIKNGSGMGNKNKLTPYQIGALLNYVWNNKSYYPDFLSALSCSGIDGTLKKRFKKSFLKGIIRAKTGTLTSYGVSNLAGFVLLPNNTFVFSILINKPQSSIVYHWDTQQIILETIFSDINNLLFKK